jgi:membrane associated rhomboid family serine protease
MLPLSDGLTARRFPLVSVALIAANLAVWILYELPDVEGAVAQASFYPCSVEGTCEAPLPWPISWLTAMFMHGSWDHLLGNMLFLAIFGKSVEAAFGRLRYLAFYVAGGFAATALQTAMTLFFSPDADALIPMLGASGAISAVLGAFLALYPHARIKTLALVFKVQIPAWLYLGGWFVYQLVEARYALVAPSEGSSGVAFFAHIGGFVFGWIFARALLDRERRRIETEARRSARAHDPRRFVR